MTHEPTLPRPEPADVPGASAASGAHTVTDLSVVIVNWNTAPLLRNCLDSLPAACDGLTREVLVVDNASRDGSAELVRTAYPGVTLLESGANRGFAGGNNLALPRCRGALVLLLNPDTVCPPGSLARSPAREVSQACTMLRDTRAR